MKKPKTAHPNTYSTAHAIYNLNKHTIDLEISVAELQLSSYQYDLLIGLIEDISKWDDKANDWDRNSNIFMNAFDLDPPEAPHLEKLDRIYGECLRESMDEYLLEKIDQARQKLNRKKQQLLPGPRLFLIPEGLFVFFYVAFFWLIQMVITIAVWIAMICGIYWFFIR